MQKTMVFVDDATGPATVGQTEGWFRKAHRRNRGFIAALAAVLLAVAGTAGWLLTL